MPFNSIFNQIMQSLFFLFISIILSQKCWSNPIHTLRINQAQKIINDLMLYPKKIFGLLPKETTGSGKDLTIIWQDLKNKGYVKIHDEREIQILKNANELFVVRDYPDYILKGLRIYRCSLQANIKSMEKKSDDWVLTGELRVIHSSQFHQNYKTLPYLNKSSTCHKQKKKWLLHYKHEWHVKEI